ncbi:MAG: hypothetical protein FJ137_01655 [Deltaproteobacteria bacterium]|nr:hypothetical protein [Deltaproteobacteria bacterium]
MKTQTPERQLAVRSLSQQALQAFMVLHRTARTHALNNDAIVAPLQGLIQAVNRLFDATGSCEFILSGTVCVTNGVIAVPELGQLEMVREVACELRARQVGGFRVFGRLGLEQARTLTTALLAGTIGVPRGGEFEVIAAAPIEAMLRDLHQTEVESITRRDAGDRAVELYGAMLTVVHRTIDGARSGQITKVLSTSRVMRELIECGQTAPQAMLGAALLRDERIPYLRRHLAGTTILAVLVGLELRLSRGDLLHLANVALMHEVGVAAYGEHLERAGRDLSPEDRQLIKDLPLLSARMFLRRRGLHHESLRNLLAAVESKRPYDQPVAPTSVSSTPRTMIAARIVQACSTFDALTSNRPFRAALTIPAALQKLEAGEPRVDPRVMNALVLVLGDPRRLVVRARAAAAASAPRPRVQGTAST